MASPSAERKEIHTAWHKIVKEYEASEPDEPSASIELEEDRDATIRGLASPSAEGGYRKAGQDVISGITEDQSWTEELAEWNEMLNCIGEDPCKISETKKRKRKKSTLQNTMDKLGLKWEEQCQQNKREHEMKTTRKQTMNVNITTSTKCNTFRMVVAIGDRKLDEIVGHLRKKEL